MTVKIQVTEKITLTVPSETRVMLFQSTEIPDYVLLTCEKHQVLFLDMWCTAWKGPLYIRGAQAGLEAILGSVTQK